MVPNAKLALSILANFHQEQADLVILINVGVSYNSDLEHVEQVTLAVARETLWEVMGGVRALFAVSHFRTLQHRLYPAAGLR